jgi:hypothetical protein
MAFRRGLELRSKSYFLQPRASACACTGETPVPPVWLRLGITACKVDLGSYIRVGSAHQGAKPHRAETLRFSPVTS